jgi:hypothetical protein
MEGENPCFSTIKLNGVALIRRDSNNETIDTFRFAAIFL